jgi:hypothetical protein
MFTTWLARLPDPVAVEVEADIAYLARFGRAAALPAVRHRIQISAHFPDMAETRSHVQVGDRGWVVRCLVVFADQERVLACCIGGDNAAWDRNHQQDWYDAHVPVADEIFRRLRTEKGWP